MYARCLKVHAPVRRALALLVYWAVFPWSHSAFSESQTSVISGAIADNDRPATDTARDSNRKPIETLTFIAVKRGDRIADYAAGSGYFTRLFSAVVGPQGHVYASVPAALFKYPNIVKGIADIQAYAVSHPNVSVTFASALGAAHYPEPLSNPVDTHAVGVFDPSIRGRTDQFMLKFRRP